MSLNFLEDVSLGSFSLRKGMITEGNYCRRYRENNKGRTKSYLVKPRAKLK